MNIFRKLAFSLIVIPTLVLSTIAFAQDEPAPTADCTLTNQYNEKDNAPGPALDKFTKDTPTIYLICQSDNVIKNDVMKAVWIADDTHNAAPNNYKIAEKSLTVEQDMQGKVYTANLSLSKPNKGWPVGSYHVELFVNADMIKSVKFTVE